MIDTTTLQHIENYFPVYTRGGEFCGFYIMLKASHYNNSLCHLNHNNEYVQYKSIIGTRPKQEARFLTQCPENFRLVDKARLQQRLHALFKSM